MRGSGLRASPHGFILKRFPKLEGSVATETRLCFRVPCCALSLFFTLESKPEHCFASGDDQEIALGGSGGLVCSTFLRYLAEEFWQQLGGEDSVHLQPWPDHDPAALVLESIEVVIQVKGKA